jgi:hypothetical protein
MEVGLGFRGRRFHQSGCHMRGFDDAILQILFVDGMNFVDEGQIARVGGVEVVTETSIDEDIDDIRETNEQLEMKPPDQQRQNVLGPNAFEPLL